MSETKILLCSDFVMIHTVIYNKFVTTCVVWSIDLSKQLQYQPLFLCRILHSIFRFAIPLKRTYQAPYQGQSPDAFLSENRTPEEFTLTLLSPK
jgi:hypothetical protein